MRLYGETAPPLNDHDYEQFVRMVVAATDPPSILEMAEDGELTPMAVAAAEYTAPELVEFIRSEAVRAITDHGPCPLHRMSFRPLRKDGAEPIEDDLS